MSMLRSLSCLTLLACIACGDGADSSADDETGEASCPEQTPPIVSFTNSTPWPFTALTYYACDGMTPNDFPFPAPGLEPGESLDVPLPGPGCYLLQLVEPSGCTLDPVLMTDLLDACSTFDIELIEDLFICPG